MALIIHKYISKQNSIKKSLLITLLLSFILRAIICQDNKSDQKVENNQMTDNLKPIKNILVNVFPGGKSHNFVLKELFDYSLNNEKDFEYRYHVLVHNWDKDAWPVNGPYKVYGYGDMKLYDVIFNEALDLVRKDPIFGYGKFNKAMVHIYEQFLESGIYDQFKNINFETIITDIPNFLTIFLRKFLNIKNNVFVSPPSLPNLYYKLFEMNPTYLPAMGSTFTDVMTFSERFTNTIYLWGMKFFYTMYAGEQAGAFERYGYELGVNFLPQDSFVMIQYPPGFFFNLSLPPNFARLNAITPKPSRPLQADSPIDKFLNKYPKNIYFSQGTIVKIVDFDKVFEVFHHFKNYGFVLAFKKKLIPIEILDKLPENVLQVEWVNQNDLLGDPRINAFITHGGCNSVNESVYHFKPMIVLGVTLDQINTAAVVKKRNVGIVIHDFGAINSQNLVDYINSILQPETVNPYLKNCKIYGKLLRGNRNPREEFHYWINYGMKLGYSHLNIESYSVYNFFEINNYDFMAVWIAILYLLYFLLKKLILFLFCTCKAEKKGKIKTT